MDPHRQHAADKNPGSRAGKYRRAERGSAVVRQPFVGPGRYQYHRPTAGPPDEETHRTVPPLPLHPGGKQRQDHRPPHAQPQPTFNVSAGTHGIVSAAQVAQVVDGRHQPGAGQSKLMLSNHQRHLRGKGEAADPHGYDQRDKTAQGNS
ncbi:hypothetical protein D3C80_1579330 [compost metagenome]